MGKSKAWGRCREVEPRALTMASSCPRLVEQIPDSVYSYSVYYCWGLWSSKSAVVQWLLSVTRADIALDDGSSPSKVNTSKLKLGRDFNFHPYLTQPICTLIYISREPFSFANTLDAHCQAMLHTFTLFFNGKWIQATFNCFQLKYISFDYLIIYRVAFMYILRHQWSDLNIKFPLFHLDLFLCS